MLRVAINLTRLISAESGSGGAGWFGVKAAEALAQQLPCDVLTTAASTPWTFGTGYIGATNGSGNSDFYITTDATHPVDLGHAHIGRVAADAIRKIINGM